MSMITGWISNIIIFILLATVVDLILPNSDLRKYTKMVTGLILISIMLAPILSLVSTPIDQVLNRMKQVSTQNDSKLNQSINLKKTDIREGQDAYILNQMAVQMKTDVEEELVTKFGVKVENIDFTIKEGKNITPQNISRVVVKITEDKDHNEVPVIQSIDINGENLPAADEFNQTKVKQYLQQKWQLTSKQLALDYVKGGE